MADKRKDAEHNDDIDKVLQGEVDPTDPTKGLDVSIPETATPRSETAEDDERKRSK